MHHRPSRLAPIVGAALTLATTIFVAAAIQPQAQAAPQAAALAIGTRIAPEGSLSACVFSYVGQGLPLVEAAKLCNADVTTAPAGTDVPDGDGEGAVRQTLTGFRTVDGGSVNVSCAGNAKIDSGIASELGDAKNALAAAQKALLEFDRANPELVGAAVYQRGELAGKVDAAQGTVNRITLEGDKRLQLAEQTKKMLEAAANGKAGTDGGTPSTQPAPAPETVPDTKPAQTPAPPPPAPATTVATSRPVTGVDEACAAFAAFVGECNLAGWATAPCQDLRRQLRGCIDSTLAYVTGDNPDEGCPADEPDEEVVAEIVELRCTSRAEVAPGYDPCGKPDLGGGPGIYEDPNADPCTEKNPYALTTPDGCEVSVQASPDFGMGPTIDPAMLVILGGPGVIPTRPTDPPWGPGIE